MQENTFKGSHTPLGQLFSVYKFSIEYYVKCWKKFKRFQKFLT